MVSRCELKTPVLAGVINFRKNEGEENKQFIVYNKQFINAYLQYLGYFYCLKVKHLTEKGKKETLYTTYKYNAFFINLAFLVEVGPHHVSRKVKL